MKRTKRIQRSRKWYPERIVDPMVLAEIAEQRGLRQDRATSQQQQADRALLMRWVRREMGRRLTRRERQFVELYYLETMTVADVAHRKKVHYTTVSRSLRRSIGKLRHAAREITGTHPSRQAVLKVIQNEEE